MCNNCDYEYYIDIMENMPEPPNIIYGILEWVEENDHITDKQKETVNNCEQRF